MTDWICGWVGFFALNKILNYIFWFFFFFSRHACAILRPIRVNDAVEWISIPLALSCNQKKCFQVNIIHIPIFFSCLFTFFVYKFSIFSDGTPCKTGFCNKGFCEPTMTDIVVRIWGFFEDFNISSVMRFLKVSTSHEFIYFIYIFREIPAEFCPNYKN